MKKTISILTLLTFSTMIIGCSSKEQPTINIQKDIKTYVKEESSSSSNKSGAISNFKRDDHRFCSRYSGFDYNNLGYSNNQGLYYGYYDQDGYFYNNIYFEYNNQYNYNDRVQRRGNFGRDSRHIRSYEYHPNNNWNRQHHYRQQYQYVGDYPYYQPHPHPRFRVYHPQHIEELSIGAGSYNNMSYRNHTDNQK
ncbi:MAG: hypothetical protein DSZ11_04970 [Sulfurovum sp.]|nr:MAG: hypothetical protein DSZ11_04970 [Sulfurovum sp.]